MYCKYCGKELRDGVVFCAYCGRRLVETAQMPVPEQTPATTEVPAAQTPVVTQMPTPAETPVVTEAPVTAQVPAPAQVPVAAEAPAMAETPAPAQAPVTAEAPVVTEAPMAAQVPVAVPAPAPTEKLKGFWAKNRLWILLAAALLVILIVVTSVVRAVNKRVDIGRFLQVDASGYDGYGTLAVDFDYTSFVERVKGDRSIKGYGDGKKTSSADQVNVNSRSALNRYAASEAERSVITDAVTIETTLPDGVDRAHLSNGDTVTLTVTFDKAAAKRFGVRVKEAVCEYTVNGLAEPGTFDVMQYFTVTFSGIDGSGRASIKSTPAQVKVGDATFTIEENSSYVNCRFADGDRSSISVYLTDANSGSLQEGDTVRLTTNADEARFAEKGVVLTNLSKEVRVEKLGKYVTALSDLKDVMPEITEKGAEDVRNYIYSNWGQAVHNSWFGSYTDQVLDESSVALYKMVLTTPKDTSSSRSGRLWCIYTATVSDSQMPEPTTLYFGVCYRNLTLDEQGKLPKNYSYSTRTNGYSTFEELMQKQIESFNFKTEQSE